MRYYWTSSFFSINIPHSHLLVFIIKVNHSYCCCQYKHRHPTGISIREVMNLLVRCYYQSNLSVYLSTLYWWGVTPKLFLLCLCHLQGVIIQGSYSCVCCQSKQTHAEVHILLLYTGDREGRSGNELRRDRDKEGWGCWECEELSGETRAEEIRG